MIPRILFYLFYFFLGGGIRAVILEDFIIVEFSSY